jgi:hypothetical protein
MAKLHLQIDNHDGPYTVSELRKRLARVLSKLNGDAEIRFMFTAALENYQPKIGHAATPAGCPACDRSAISKIPDSPTTRHAVPEPSLAEIIERNCSLLKKSSPKIV